MLDAAASFFESINAKKDEVLCVYIEKYWPREILPNHLTIARLAIGAILAILLFLYDNDNPAFIISLFTIGILTDFLDGPVARALHKETNIGAMMDALADRVLIIPIALYSLFGLHYWLLLWIIALEAVNTLISIHPDAPNHFVETNIFGKVKMFLQSIVFLGILLYWPNVPHIAFIYLLWASVIALLASIVVKIKYTPS